MVSMDRSQLQEFLERVADKYTASELVDLLDLSVWQIIDALEDEIIEGREKLEL